MLCQDPEGVASDFYDTLQIQALLQREEMRATRDSDREPQQWHSSTARTTWQRLLDDICFLCDNKRGGKTTTSMAVQQKADNAVLWFTVNRGHARETELYLRRVLHLICDLDSNVPMHSKSDQILIGALARSRPRVANYAKRLTSVLVELENRETQSADGV